MLIRKVINRIAHSATEVVQYFYSFGWGRKLLWELKARKIHDHWGNNRIDYPVIKCIIEQIHAQKILDIGVGSGRLFEVYSLFPGLQIHAQDISRNALILAEKRSEALGLHVRFYHQDLTTIHEPFDLIISNRVLAAVRPEHIGTVIKHLGAHTHYFYINEPIQSDALPYEKYWFSHDYDHILSEFHFVKITEGKIEQQTYTLWKKI